VQRFGFDAATAQRTFRLHMPDSIEIIAIPSLRARVEEMAPQVRLEAVQVPPDRIPQALQSGEIDFAIGSYGAMGDGIIREHLLNDAFVLLVERSHPMSGEAARETLQQTHYVVVGESPDIEQLMADLGLNRQIRVRTSFYLSVPALLRSSGLAVWLPHSIAQAFVALGEYRIVTPTMQQRAVAVNVFRHPRAVLDPALVWMWNLLLDTLRSPAEAP
jgi:DNA-binding transcriptional LysR family regulator